jgi:hypothetical protein
MPMMEPATTTRFALAARALALAARSLGLRAPSFRSPPRLVGADRSLRTRGGRLTVCVRVRGRPWVPVLADMVEGVVAANRLAGPPAARARAALWGAVAPPEAPAAIPELEPPAAVAFPDGHGDPDVVSEPRLVA